MIKKDNGEPVGLVDISIMLLCILAIIVSVTNSQPSQDCPDILQIIEVQQDEISK